MAIKNAQRKITYHILKFVKKKSNTVIYTSFNFNDFVTWFNTIDERGRLYGISATKFTSLDILETVPKRSYQGYTNVVFGMMSTGNHGSRKNLKDSQNNTKRENPKKLEEGEEQENYFLLAFKTAGDIEVVFQNSAHSIKHHQFKDYLEKFIIKYISAKGTTKDFDIIEGSVIEDENTMIDKLDRVNIPAYHLPKLKLN